MNDVCFNIDGIWFAYKDSLKLEIKLSESIYNIAGFAKHLDSEISAFYSFGRSTVNEVGMRVAEVRSLINQVESKKTSAESQKRQPLPPPSPPAVSQNATPEEKEAIMADYNRRCHQVEIMNGQIRERNGKIESYVTKCDRTLSKLREILSRITALESVVRNESSRVDSVAKSDLVAVQNAVRSIWGINNAMNGFTVALSQTLECARDLYNLKPSGINSPAYGNMYFRIENRHTASGTGSAVGLFQDSISGIRTSFESNKEESKGDKDASAESEEGDLINEINEDSFIEKIKPLTSFKMLGSNLHKLGGRSFVSKLNALGYGIKSIRDGRITDENGIMYWEKKND